MFKRAQNLKKVVARPPTPGKNPDLIRLPPMDMYGTAQHRLEGTQETSPKEVRGKAFYFGREHFIESEESEPTYPFHNGV